jgi:hypothetical protein
VVWEDGAGDRASYPIRSQRSQRKTGAVKAPFVAAGGMADGHVCVPSAPQGAVVRFDVILARRRRSD